MPIYEFVCPKCGRRDEVLARMADREDIKIACSCGTAMVYTFSSGQQVVFAPPLPKLTNWHRTRKYR